MKLRWADPEYARRIKENLAKHASDGGKASAGTTKRRQLRAGKLQVGDTRRTAKESTPTELSARGVRSQQGEDGRERQTQMGSREGDEK